MNKDTENSMESERLGPSRAKFLSFSFTDFFRVSVPRF